MQKIQRQQNSCTMPSLLRTSLEETEETCQSATEVLMKGSTWIRTLNPGWYQHMEVEVFSHYLGWFSARRHICWTCAGALGNINLGSQTSLLSRIYVTFLGNFSHQGMHWLRNTLGAHGGWGKILWEACLPSDGKLHGHQWRMLLQKKNKNWLLFRIT